MSLALSRGPEETSQRARAIDARRRLFGGSKVTASVIPPPVEAKATKVDIEKAAQLQMAPGYAIIAAVAKKYGLAPSQLIGPSRAKNITPARHEAMFRIVTELDYSYPKAGRCMGGRDHTTAIHSVKVFAEQSENAAEVLLAHYRREANKNERYRARCIEMHRDGFSPIEIAKRVRVSVGALLVWIDEYVAAV